jgi:hypothetical protein
VAENTLCSWVVQDDGVQASSFNFRAQAEGCSMSAVKKKKPAAKKKKAGINLGQIALNEHEAMIEERYAYALEIKQAQDETTEAAINRMVMRMLAMAGPPIFYHNGISVAADEERLKSIQVKSLTWIAVRLMVACAEWDIRIANFTAPKKKCAKCGKKVK